MNLQDLINKAWDLKKEGKLIETLDFYNKAYDILIRESVDYAKNFGGSEINEGKTRKVMPQFFNKADEYLKKDNVVCTILNNMGVIFAELGDKETAKKYFQESIKFTPENFDYSNPHIGLKELVKKIKK